MAITYRRWRLLLANFLFSHTLQIFPFSSLSNFLLLRFVKFPFCKFSILHFPEFSQLWYTGKTLSRMNFHPSGEIGSRATRKSITFFIRQPVYSRFPSARVSYFYLFPRFFSIPHLPSFSPTPPITAPNVAPLN